MKLPDYYFAALVTMRETCNEVGNKNSIPVVGIILDNRNVDGAIQNTNWNVLLTLYHITLHDKFLDTFHLIYTTSSKPVNIKQGKPDNNWLAQEIIELYYIKAKAWQSYMKDPRNTALRQEFRTL